MRIYSISVLDGRETIVRDVMLHSYEVKSFLANDLYKYKFVIVDVYIRHERKRSSDTHDEPARFLRSIIYLGSVELERTVLPATFEDIDVLKDDLTCIIHLDGTQTYIPAVPLSCLDVEEFLGRGNQTTMYIVKDEPQRWAAIGTAPDQYGLTEKPKLNKTATELFGRDLYGDVLFVNENLVS